MFGQKMIREEQELIKTLEAIENAPPDDFRKLFEASHLSKDEFVSGIMMLSAEEQNALVEGMLNDALLRIIMADKLTNWQNRERVEKSNTLMAIYEIVECASKSTAKEICKPKCKLMDSGEIDADALSLVSQIKHEDVRFEILCNLFDSNKINIDEINILQQFEEMIKAGLLKFEQVEKVRNYLEQLKQQDGQRFDVSIATVESEIGIFNKYYLLQFRLVLARINDDNETLEELLIELRGFDQEFVKNTVKRSFPKVCLDDYPDMVTLFRQHDWSTKPKAIQRVIANGKVCERIQNGEAVAIERDPE